MCKSSQNILLIICSNISGKLHNLKYITFGSNSPLFIGNTVFHLLPSLIHTLLYFQIRSSLLKYFVFLSLSITSSIYKHDTIYSELDSTISSALSCLSSYWFKALSFLTYVLVFNSFGVISSKLISWFYPLLSSSFSNFFLLNRCVNSQIYSGKSSRLVESGFLPISWYSLSVSFIGFILLVLDVNAISWCYVLYPFRYLVNHIFSLF